MAREQSRVELAAKAVHPRKCLDAAGRKGSPMSCEHLICAQCAGPVVEG